MLFISVINKFCLQLLKYIWYHDKLESLTIHENYKYLEMHKKERKLFFQ